LASTATTLLTAEDLDDLPENPCVWRYELVEGEPVEVSPAGMVHTLIVGLIYRLLANHLDQHNSGLVIVDGLGYVLERDPDTLRVPDVSFISRARLPESGPTGSFADTVPDLVVEVVSPGNTAAELRRRTRDYLAAGVPSIWIAWPEERSMSVYTESLVAIELDATDTPDGGDVLPGFSVTVAELFDIEW
jgi:Uma2 family endonuclease